MIDADLIPPLVHMLGEAEFDIKKEAAWAISNATSGGRQDQIKYLVNCGAIKPLCDLLTCSDARIVTVALEGIENILKVGPAALLQFPFCDSSLGNCTLPVEVCTSLPSIPPDRVQTTCASAARLGRVRLGQCFALLEQGRRRLTQCSLRVTVKPPHHCAMWSWLWHDCDVDLRDLGRAGGGG